MDENRITGAAKEVGGKVQGAVGDLTGDHQVQAEGKTTELKGSAENLAGQAKDAVRDIAGQATSMAQNVLDQGRSSFPDAEHAYRQGSQAVSQYTKDSPLIVALIAGGIGYGLALLIHRGR